MSSIPLSITKYMRSLWMSEWIVTYLHVDHAGDLTEWGGHPRHYGLPPLITDKNACEQISFLEGIFPVMYTQVLEFMSFDNGCVAHVHLIPISTGIWVLFCDATSEHDRQQKMQQQYNELSIVSYRQSQMLQELSDARTALVEEKHKLIEASEYKSHFIATLSHELRSSLTSIVGYSKLLEDLQAIDSHERQYLDTVKSNANHLLSLIDTLLGQFNQDTSNITLKPTPCRMQNLLDDLQHLFFPMAEEKNLIFELQLTDAVPEQVLVDELRLRQILINLITNALKFTQQGFIRVNVHWEEDFLQLKISDSGLGISTELQKSMFQPFKRGDGTADLPGIGLGLSISHQLVTLMQGQLSVNSTLDQGSIFSAYVHAPNNHVVATAVTDKSVNTARILLAEDSHGIRLLLELYLGESGYDVICAENGEAALKLALEKKPDMLITDLQMPVLNGFELIKTLREKHQFKHSIIALSASNTDQDRQQAIQAGCDAYLMKPVDHETLLHTVKNLLQPLEKSS